MTVDNQTFVKVTLSLCVLIDWLCIFTLTDNIEYMEVNLQDLQKLQINDDLDSHSLAWCRSIKTSSGQKESDSSLGFFFSFQRRSWQHHL